MEDAWRNRAGAGHAALGGQLDPEAGTAARAAFHADGAAMRFDDRAHDGEAQAGSPRLPVVGHAYAMSETLWM